MLHLNDVKKIEQPLVKKKKQKKKTSNPEKKLKLVFIRIQVLYSNMVTDSL